MTAEEKMDKVLAQVRACDDGQASAIICPYCDSINVPDVPFCCKTLSNACIAALERIRLEQAAERMAEIQERHARN